MNKFCEVAIQAPVNASRPRIIRSYVRREGRMTERQMRAIELYWQEFGLSLEHDVFNFKAIFGREAPCILEIGFGMGDSLLSMAKAMPEKNFIGVEVYRPGIGAVLAELVAQEITNIRVICADAKDVLMQKIADSSLTGVQIFFPDPWPKKRHHKRRLVTNEFIELIYQKLKIGGFFHLATDWQNYALQMQNVLSNCLGFANLNVARSGFAPQPIPRPTTKFEQRGKQLGHDIWDLLAYKQMVAS